MGMMRGIFGTVALAALTATMLSGCAMSVDGGIELPDAVGVAAEAESMTAADAWVVVSFEDLAAEFDADAMNALLPTELAADEALAEADAGWIDGNEVGDNSYTLYFVGEDPAEIWATIEPVFAAASVPWTSVELHESFDDAQPIVLTPPR